MITLIGTGHVFNLSDAILEIFEEKQPDIVCVELDKQRFSAMLLKKNDPEGYKRAEKNVPAIYKMLARFQNSMAKEYGVTAGQEMMTAIEYAQNHQLPVAFIDRNAQNVFAKMLKSMSFSEKFKLFFTGFAGFFVRKKRVEKELKNFEKDFDGYIEEIGKKFPTIKRVLIDERNEYMLNQITEANKEYENIVAVMGDGHIPGISKLLKDKDVDFETVRLSQLRAKENKNVDTSTASFTVNHK